MRVLQCTFVIVLIAVGAQSCCDSYKEVKEVFKGCEVEKKDKSPETLCQSMGCIAKGWDIMAGGKVSKERMIQLIEKIFPDASERLKTSVASCIDEANKENNECKMYMMGVHCVVSEHENFLEINSLISKRETM